MPYYQDFTPDEEDQLRNELAAADQRMNSYRAAASPTLAENVSMFFRIYPGANLATLIPAARAYTDGVMNQDQAQEFLKAVMMRELADSIIAYNQKLQADKDKGWFERNIADKAKAGARYVFAGGQSVLDFGQNLVGRGFTEVYEAVGTARGAATTGRPVSLAPRPSTTASERYQAAASEVLGSQITEIEAGRGGLKELWLSTELGTLIANDEIAGEGFFLGGRAKELQSERAREFRGTIDGHAATLGRGVALLVAQPGTATYNNISGVLDAAAAILTPALPGFKYGKEVAAGLSAKTGLRTLAGLADVESATIDAKKVADFFGSRSGRKVLDRFSKIKSVDEALGIFGGSIEASFITNLVDVAKRTQIAKGAGDANYLDEMRMFVNDTFGLGDITRGLAPISIDNINISRWDDVKLNIAQRESKVARMMAKMYSRDVIIAGGSQRQMLESIRNVKSFLQAMKVDPKRRAELVDNFANALVKGNGEVAAVVPEITKTLKEQFRVMKVSNELADELLNGLDKTRTLFKDRMYGFRNNLGESYAFDDLGGTVIDQDGVLRNFPLNTAGLQSEMLKHSLILPDPRRVRRIASQYSILSAITTKQKLTRGIRDKAADRFASIQNADKYGELRVPFVALEFLQNQIWRPITLMTGGYIMRNMTDSALRMSFAPDLQTNVFHPVQHLMYATYRRGKGDIEGILYSNNADELWRLGHREYADAINAQIREGLDARVRYAHEQKTGVWVDARRDGNINEYVEGIAAEVGLLRTDPFAVRIANGDSLDEIMTWATRNTEESRNAVRSIQSRWSNVEMPNAKTGQVDISTADFIDSAGRINEPNLRSFLDLYIRPRIEMTIGGNDTLRQVIAEGRFVDSAGRTINAYDLGPGGIIIGFNKKYIKEVKRIASDPNARLMDVYKRQIIVKPTADGRFAGPREKVLESWDGAVNKFFGQLYGRSEAFLNRSPAFRQFYYAQIGRFMDELAPGEAARVIDNIAKSATRDIESELRYLKRAQPDASGLYGFRGRNLTKQQIDDLIAERTDDLAEAQRRIAGRKPVAGGVSERFIVQYVGDRKVAEKLIGKANGSIPSNGGLSLEEINHLAKGYALDATKELFYNASTKSNFGDVARIIAPFGSAWYEVMRNWSRMAARNPEIIKRGGVTVQGLQDADPDNDGKGFFWKDPTTGEYVFNYPFEQSLAPFMSSVAGAFSGAVAAGPVGALVGGAAGAGVGAAIQPALSGIRPTLTAPVKSLNMGLQVLPGLGPYVQVSAEWAMRNRPDLDFWRKLVAPYGVKDYSFVTAPAWFDKAYAAFFGNPETTRILADLKIDVIRALGSTGEYDQTTEEGKLELEREAESRARILLGLRALGQFIGPSRPKIDFTIDTKQGDVMASELSRAYYEMRANNPDGAVQQFMDTFGDDSFLYTAGKSRAIAGGLDVSTEFGKWERQNGSLFEKYPDVAGYFAPIGSKFDYQVFIRQIENGRLREKVRPSEYIDLAQQIVGTALYRYAVNQFPVKLNDDERADLADIKKMIEDQYPGFRSAGFDVKGLENKIERLYEASFNAPELNDNPIAIASREYFRNRDEVLRIVEARDEGKLGAKANEDLRGELRAVGEQLARTYPEFGRVWDDVLFREVEPKD